jgi:hypothetical protein
MAKIRQRLVRASVAAAAVAGLTGVGLVTTQVASAAPSSPQIRVSITDHGMYVDGPSTIHAGRLRLAIDATDKERGIEIVRLDPGYSFHDFRADLKIAFTNLFAPNGDKKKGLKHLNHAINHITGYGGLYAYPGQVRHATVLLDQPSSRYVLYDDSSDLPKRPHHITVTSASGPQTLPSTSKHVFAKTNRRFGGSTTLPHNGSITFKNLSTESPHFLVFLQVKEGTTRKQVIQGLQGNGPPPDFFLKGEQDVDVLTYNQAMTVRLHLPKGEYAIACFFPDPKTGMPHAFMGMVRIVHLV